MQAHGRKNPDQFRVRFGAEILSVIAAERFLHHRGYFLMKMFIAAAGGFLHQDNTLLAVCGEIPDDLDLIVVCGLGMFLLHLGKPGKELPGICEEGI